MDLGVEMGSKTTIKVPFLYVLNDNESCFKKINTHLRMQQMKKKVTFNVRCKLVIILYLFPDVHGPESLKLHGRK